MCTKKKSWLRKIDSDQRMKRFFEMNPLNLSKIWIRIKMSRIRPTEKKTDGTG